MGLAKEELARDPKSEVIACLVRSCPQPKMAEPLMDLGGIVGLVVGNLEAKEGVNDLDGFGVGGRDLDFGAAIGFHVAIADFVAEFGHDRSARRIGVVDEHGHIEIAGGEAFGDVREVHADLFARGGVLGVVGGDVDDAAGFGEAEAVSGCFMRKTHGMVTAGGHDVVVGWV